MAIEGRGEAAGILTNSLDNTTREPGHWVAGKRALPKR
jgi:hypothetical protein